jgi:phage tail-like protein
MGFGSAPFGSAPFGSSSFGPEELGVVDIAFNPLALGAQASMLGWTDAPAEDETLNQRIYEFLLENIRREDQLRGNMFLKRFLQGPQDVWDQTWQRIFALETLHSVDAINDDFLPYLQDIVGWVGGLKRITVRLAPAGLRRLISVSARFWKRRGTEDTIPDMLRLMTGARIRTWNWFDYRWVLEETGLGHEQDGHDPWLISVDNDREINVRIVDGGSLDKELVREMLKLMRPSGERVEVVYLSFLDVFETPGDESQWTGFDATEDGMATLSDTAAQEAIVSVEGALAWQSYVVAARIRGIDYGLVFHWQNEFTKYVFRVEGNTWILSKQVGSSSETVILSGSPPGPYAFVDNEWYVIRVQIVWDGSTNQIKAYADGILIVETTDSDIEIGTVGLMHAVDGNVSCDEIEVIPLPVNSDFIDINSRVAS